MKHVHKATNFLEKLSSLNQQKSYQVPNPEDDSRGQSEDLRRWNPPDTVSDVREMDTFTRHEVFEDGLDDSKSEDFDQGSAEPISSSKYMDPVVSRLLQGMRPKRSRREVGPSSDSVDPVVSRLLQAMKPQEFRREASSNSFDHDSNVEGSGFIEGEYELDLDAGVINIDGIIGDGDVDDIDAFSSVNENAWEDYQLEYNYLDDLLYGLDDTEGEDDEDQDRSDEDSEEYSKNIVFRDFPLEDGYVRIPIKYPGLNISKVEPPNPKLWTAEDAFMEQVVPSLYMFVPAALLGFIIGMAVWLVVLVILRTYSSFRKAVKDKNEEPQKDIINDIKYSLSEDPWKKISDAETVHGVDGSMRKGDRVWNLRKESGLGREVVGGSDRKPRRSTNHDVSSMSAGKNMKF